MPTAEKNLLVVWPLRALLLGGTFWLYRKESVIQSHIDNWWPFVRDTSVFRTVYFETVWTTLIFAILMGIPMIFEKIRLLDGWTFFSLLIQT